MEAVMRNVFRLLTLFLLVGVAVAQTPAKSAKPHPKISKEEATKTALAKVPNGTVKEAELENEKGKLVWSFDIATPGSKDISEVQVDANTGEVVSVTKESPKAEAAEKKKEQKH
ncbi:MAG TPA: PepSY domain-containing protein [Terriglobales bacterium]